MWAADQYSIEIFVLNCFQIETKTITGFWCNLILKLFRIKSSIKFEIFTDYGYVMDIGLQAVQAFLPKKKIEKYVNEFLDGEYPSVGQLVPCVVTQLNGPAAKLSAEPSKLRTNVTEVNT